MSQLRAKKGGEMGRNNEWYPAGSFICTTDLAKMAKPERKAGTGKQNYEPYKWSVAPEGKTFAIFKMVGGQAEYIDRYDTEKGIRPSAAGVAYYGDDFHGHKVADLCEAYNRGERWM